MDLDNKDNRKRVLLANLGENTLRREELVRQIQALEQQANGIKTQLFVLDQALKAIEPSEKPKTVAPETCEHKETGTYRDEARKVLVTYCMSCNETLQEVPNNEGNL